MGVRDQSIVRTRAAMSGLDFGGDGSTTTLRIKVGSSGKSITPYYWTMKQMLGYRMKEDNLLLVVKDTIHGTELYIIAIVNRSEVQCSDILAMN
jgi:hypothetical protein